MGMFNDINTLTPVESKHPLGLGAVALFGNHLTMALQKGGDLSGVAAHQVCGEEGPRYLREELRLELLNLARGTIEKTQLLLEALQNLEVTRGEGLQASAEDNIDLTGDKGQRGSLPKG